MLQCGDRKAWYDLLPFSAVAFEDQSNDRRQIMFAAGRGMYSSCYRDLLCCPIEILLGLCSTHLQWYGVILLILLDLDYCLAFPKQREINPSAISPGSRLMHVGKMMLSNRKYSASPV